VIAHERVAWAEGQGLDKDTIELLTEIAEEADRRLGADRPAGFVLPADDVASWGLLLDDAGLEDLAQRAKEIARQATRIAQL